ncbi:MAG: YkvA family protein [Terriglobia bacterium]
MSALKEALLAVPRVALLIPKLATDERVPLRTKLALTGLGLYIASPWDLIPDFIPVLGQLDDAAAVLLFVDGVLNAVDDDILVEHWTGDLQTLRRLQRLARLVAGFVPARLRRFLFGRAIQAGRKRLRASSAVGS